VAKKGAESRIRHLQITHQQAWITAKTKVLFVDDRGEKNITRHTPGMAKHLFS